MSADFRIAGWLVQPSLNRMTQGDNTVRLEPKVMQVLVCLAEHPGEVVPREALIARVWPDVFVTDDVLHRAVRELRRVFGDDAATPRCIETIRKRGYRLIAPVSAPTLAPASARPDAVPIDAEARATGPVAWWPFTAVALSLAALCAAVILTLTSRPAIVSTEAHPRFVALTGGGFNEIDPALAPDGRQVVFVQRQSSDDRAPADLYLSVQPGRTPERLTTDAANERLPVWSADGRRLAFLRITHDTCDVIVRTIADAAEQRVMSCANRHQPRLAWSGDGSSLVLSIADTPHAAHGWRIATRSLTTGEQRILTSPPAGMPGDHSPVVSPDGRRVAFVRHASGGVADIFVVPIEGGTARRVTYDESDLEGVAWTDGGRALVFSSDRAGGYTLWRVPTDGGAPQFVAGGAARLKHPVASHDGQRIAYENWAYEINIAAAAAGAAPTAPVRHVTRTSDLWNYFPRVSPDGSRVAYVSTQSGSQELWIANRDGSTARKLTDFSRLMRSSSSRGAALRMPQWSSDGRRIAVVAHSGRASDVFIVDVGSGSIDALTSDAHLEVAPAWSADGRRLYVGTRRDGRWDVWSLPAAGNDGADPPRVVVEGAYAAQPSPDGASLYFTYPDRSGLWRRRLTGGTVERVVDGIAAADWANWQLTARGIFHVAVGAADVMIVRRSDLDGRNPQTVATLDQLSWPGISVTPAGDEVLYARWDRRQSRIMVLEASQ